MSLQKPEKIQVRRDLIEPRLLSILDRWVEFPLPPDVRERCSLATAPLREAFEGLFESSMQAGLMQKDNLEEAAAYVHAHVEHIATASVFLGFEFGVPYPNPEIRTYLEDVGGPTAGFIGLWLEQYVRAGLASREEIDEISCSIGKILFSTAEGCYQIGITTGFPLDSQGD